MMTIQLRRGRLESQVRGHTGRVVPGRRRRAWAIRMAIAVALAMVVVGCSSDSDDAKSPSTDSSGGTSTVAAPAGLVNAGKFTTCTDASFPPMESFEDGSDTPVGFDIDVINSLAKSWGVEPNVINTGFDGLLPGLSSGRCDAVWSGIYVTAERLEQFPAVAYLKTGSVALVQDGNPAGITSYEDMYGKTLAVQSGTSLLDEVANKIAADAKAAGEPEPKIQLYPNATDLIQQLLLGRVDAVFTADTEAAYRSVQNPGKFEVGYAFPEKLQMGVYYDGSKTEIGEAIATGLQSLYDDGTLQSLAEKYELDPSNLEIVKDPKG